MHIKGFIFDLDGTLGDTLPVIVPALQETFRRFGGRDYTDDEISAMFGPSEEGVIMRRVPPERYPAALDCYLELYAAGHYRVTRPFDGIIELLEMLRARGIRRGLVTGKGPHTTEITLRIAGLAPLIEAVETGSPEGAVKPEAIRRVLDAWGLLPQEVVYVGDTPYDMDASREVGVVPAGAAWAASATVRPGDAAHVFTSVAQMADWVREGANGLAR